MDWAKVSEWWYQISTRTAKTLFNTSTWSATNIQTFPSLLSDTPWSVFTLSSFVIIIFGGTARHCEQSTLLCCRHGASISSGSAEGLLNNDWHAAALTSVSYSALSHCAYNSFSLSCPSLTCFSVSWKSETLKRYGYV